MYINVKYIRIECWIFVFWCYRLILFGYDMVINKYVYIDFVIFNMKMVKWI